MFLRLVPPTPGRSRFYRVRGSYRGRDIDRSTKETTKSAAQAFLREYEKTLERRQSSVRSAAGGLTFAAAVRAYISAGHGDRFLTPIVDHFGANLSVYDIDQAAVDGAADAIFPFGNPATKNRQVYTPISAVLRHNGVKLDLNRPKGAQGRRRTLWLRPDQFEKVVKHAEDRHPELAAMMVTLCYTGMRLGEALALTCDDLDLIEGTAIIHKGKNGDPRMVHLPPRVVARLKNHPTGIDRGQQKVFRFVRDGALNDLAHDIYDAAKVNCGDAPFHIFRHTWATWMVRQGVDLVATGAWRSPTSARNYTHFVTTEEALKANNLPGAKVSIAV